MPFHKIKIANECDDSFCHRMVVWEILDNENSSYGSYCIFHAHEKLSVLREAEDRASSDKNGK